MRTIFKNLYFGGILYILKRRQISSKNVCPFGFAVADGRGGGCGGDQNNLQQLCVENWYFLCVLNL